MALGWLWWRAWFYRGAAAFCVAGVALGCTLSGRHSTWRHVAALLRGRRGTYGTGLALVARLVLPWRRGVLRGRRGTWRHVAAL